MMEIVLCAIYRPGYGPLSQYAGAHPSTHPRQAYSRPALLRDYDVVREVDLEGNYHPAEITRKISREITRLGFHIIEEGTDIQKNPVGQATGETFGYVRAGASETVSPAGHVSYFESGAFAAIVAMLVFLTFLFFAISPFFWPSILLGLLFVIVLFYVVANREKIFRKYFTYASRTDVDFAIGIPGEVYEDFRSRTRTPIRTNLSVIVSGRARGVRLTSPEQETLISRRDTQHQLLQEQVEANQYWGARVAGVVEAIVSGLESAR